MSHPNFSQGTAVVSGGGMNKRQDHVGNGGEGESGRRLS